MRNHNVEELRESCLAAIKKNCKKKFGVWFKTPMRIFFNESATGLTVDGKLVVKIEYDGQTKFDYRNIDDWNLDSLGKVRQRILENDELEFGRIIVFENETIKKYG